MAAMQIKDVPVGLHERARERAEQLDLTLGEYVLSLIRRDLERGEVREWRERLLSRPITVIPSGLVLELIREVRGEDE
nr:hypothetical protein [Acidobacteriota bacterium]